MMNNTFSEVRGRCYQKSTLYMSCSDDIFEESIDPWRHLRLGLLEALATELADFFLLIIILSVKALYLQLL